MTFMEEILTQTSTVGYTLSLESTHENTFYAPTAQVGPPIKTVTAL